MLLLRHRARRVGARNIKQTTRGEPHSILAGKKDVREVEDAYSKSGVVHLGWDHGECEGWVPWPWGVRWGPMGVVHRMQSGDDLKRVAPQDLV